MKFAPRHLLVGFAMIVILAGVAGGAFMGYRDYAKTRSILGIATAVLQCFVFFIPFWICWRTSFNTWSLILEAGQITVFNAVGKYSFRWEDLEKVSRTWNCLRFHLKTPAPGFNARYNREHMGFDIGLSPFDSTESLRFLQRVIEFYAGHPEHREELADSVRSKERLAQLRIQAGA